MHMYMCLYVCMSLSNFSTTKLAIYDTDPQWPCHNRMCRFFLQLQPYIITISLSHFSFFKLTYLFCWFERQSDRQSRFLICLFTSQTPTTTWAQPGHRQVLGTQTGSSKWVARTQALQPSPTDSWSRQEQEVGTERKLELRPRQPSIWSGHPNGGLTTIPNTHSSFLFSFLACKQGRMQSRSSYFYK